MSPFDLRDKKRGCNKLNAKTYVENVSVLTCLETR